MKILVTYDGTLSSKDVLRYGIDKTRQAGGSLFVLYVFNRAKFIDYEGGLDAEEIARRESGLYIADAKMIINETGKGLDIDIIEEEGNLEEEIINFAIQKKVDLILTTPRYRSIVKKAPCPVSIIPGIILMPIDNTDNYEFAISNIIKEAKFTSSKVILLGIVPVHLYSRSEKEELNRIRNEILRRLKKAKQILRVNGIEVKEILRSGFVDEEILRCAQEYEVSMIMISAYSNRPSELKKAVDIINREKDLLKAPLWQLPANI